MKAKLKKRSATISPVLEQILHGGSSVSFNLISLDSQIGDGERMFRNRPLNRIILFKYPNFSDTGSTESLATFGTEDLSDTDRPVETGMYVPYDSLLPDGGGCAIYLRAKNYGDLLREHFGFDVNVQDPAVEADLRILSLIDGIPSLDAFLLKTCFEAEKIQIDPRYWKIAPEEDNQIRRLIAQRIEPIVRKALESDRGGGAFRIDQFLEAIWNPALPEARLFISAFGIGQGEAEQVFSAWKGITFYEFQLRRIAPASRAILTWLKSTECLPMDIRANKHMETQLLMFTEKIGKSLESVLIDIKNILSDYEVCFRKFMEGSPEAFTNFLRRVREKYWLMGYCISSLGSVNHIFDRYMRNIPNKRLYFEPMYEMLKQFDVALDRRRERSTAF